MPEKQFHLVVVYGDVDPLIMGPFEDEESRDQRAIQLKRQHGDDHGIYMLDWKVGDDGGIVPEIYEYSAGFFVDALGDGIFQE